MKCIVMLLSVLAALCACGSNPTSPADPPPVEPPIEMPEGAVVAYEDSTYTVLYDASNVYVYFHPESGNGMKIYIRPSISSSEDFWDVKTQGSGQQQSGPSDHRYYYNTWFQNWHLEYDDSYFGASQNVTLIEGLWTEGYMEGAYYSLISFPRYVLDPDYDYRIETGWYDVSVNTDGFQGSVEAPTSIYID